MAREARANDVADDASKAEKDNRHVFVVQVRAGMSFTASLTREVPGFGEVIEAVELRGWKLDQQTIVIHDGKPTAYMTFRR